MIVLKSSGIISPAIHYRSDQFHEIMNCLFSYLLISSRIRLVNVFIL